MVKGATSPVRVLVTDDEKDLRWALATLLQREGFQPLEADHGGAAIRMVREGRVDVMLLDLVLPGMTGLEIVEEVRAVDPGLPVVLLTGCGSADAAVAAGRAGVQGFLTKPYRNDEVVYAVRMAAEARRRWPGRPGGGPARESAGSLREFMGPSAAIQDIMTRVERVAPTEFTVIIGGETGVGKEVVAQAIHQLSPRAAGPFVPVDCGSIPETLIESELFGHEKGAFTGADRARAGCFEAAAGGTLFLDEIGNLPLLMQAKLLRALQERRVYRLGGVTPVRLNVRILTASNENLPALVEAGRFRQDLYYRLNEFALTVPPLHARPADIVFLARRFLAQACDELRKPDCAFTDAALQHLQAYTWPGNVRELRNLVRRSALLAESHIGPDLLREAGLPAATEAAGGPESAPLTFKEIILQNTQAAERELLVQVLEMTRGNMKKAARVLQMDYKTIRTKVRKHHLGG